MSKSTHRKSKKRSRKNRKMRLSKRSRMHHNKKVSRRTKKQIGGVPVPPSYPRKTYDPETKEKTQKILLNEALKKQKEILAKQYIDEGMTPEDARAKAEAELLELEERMKRSTVESSITDSGISSEEEPEPPKGTLRGREGAVRRRKTPSQKNNQRSEKPKEPEEPIFGTRKEVLGVDTGYMEVGPPEEEEDIYRTLGKPPQKPKQILVFDFDQTFIPQHSGGFPITKNIPKLDFDAYNSLLEKLNEHFKIYINSRGIVKDKGANLEIGEYLEPLKYFIPSANIRGASCASNNINFFDEKTGKYTTNCKEIGTPVFYNKKYGEAAQKTDNPNTKWAIKKSEILEEIFAENKKENKELKKEDIYFFDDTRENIAMAIDNDFNNSFVVHVVYPKNKKGEITEQKNVNAGIPLLKKIVELVTNKNLHTFHY
jgi:hypothetical protein